MERAQRLLRSLTKESRIIEIGPSLRPLAPKREGWDTFVVDHATRDELVAKYADHDVSSIEDVDYVWHGGSLEEAVPADRHCSFDAFVASHVIEHTTDIVTFLKAAETLIRPDGVIVLAVPDKRKCFDFYRHPSTTADALAAFAERRERHDLRTHVEYAVRSVGKGGGPGWSMNDSRDAVFHAPFDRAEEAAALAARPDYVDAHNWVFVPASFTLMLLELAALGHLDLHVEEVVEAYEAEFFVWLRKGRADLAPDALQARRKFLMDRIVLELAAQVRQIPCGPTADLPASSHDRERIEELTYARQAVESVLAAVLASTGRFGLDRKAFKRMIQEAARAIPPTGPATIQHGVLRAEAAKVLKTHRPRGLAGWIGRNRA